MSVSLRDGAYFNGRLVWIVVPTLLSMHLGHVRLDFPYPVYTIDIPMISNTAEYNTAFIKSTVTVFMLPLAPVTVPILVGW